MSAYHCQEPRIGAPKIQGASVWWPGTTGLVFAALAISCASGGRSPPSSGLSREQSSQPTRRGFIDEDCTEEKRHADVEDDLRALADTSASVAPNRLAVRVACLGNEQANASIAWARSLLAAESPVVRRRAAVFLLWLGDDDAIPVLVKDWHAASRPSDGNALALLSIMKDPRTAPIAFATTEHFNPRVRALGLRLLDLLQPEGALATFVRHFRDHEAYGGDVPGYPSHAAIDAVSRMQRDIVLPYLVSALDTESVGFALQALRKLTGATITGEGRDYREQVADAAQKWRAWYDVQYPGGRERLPKIPEYEPPPIPWTEHDTSPPLASRESVLPRPSLELSVFGTSDSPSNVEEDVEAWSQRVRNLVRAIADTDPKKEEKLLRGGRAFAIRAIDSLRRDSGERTGERTNVRSSENGFAQARALADEAIAILRPFTEAAEPTGYAVRAHLIVGEIEFAFRRFETARRAYREATKLRDINSLPVRFYATYKAAWCDLYLGSPGVARAKLRWLEPFVHETLGRGGLSMLDALRLERPVFEKPSQPAANQYETRTWHLYWKVSKESRVTAPVASPGGA